MKFSIKDFFSKCDQIRSFLWIWSHILKKSLMENFILCSVTCFLASHFRLHNFQRINCISSGPSSCVICGWWWWQVIFSECSKSWCFRLSVWWHGRFCIFSKIPFLSGFEFQELLLTLFLSYCWHEVEKIFSENQRLTPLPITPPKIFGKTFFI